MWSQPDLPYNDLPDPPPVATLETVAVLRKAISARAALAELKGLCQVLPKPELLLNSIVLQESQDSSAIENIVTTKDQLYQAILNPQDNWPSAVREVMRYREALNEGLAALKRTGGIGTNTAVLVMRRIKDTTAGVRNLPGTKLSNPATGRIMYTPPDTDRVPALLTRWERFAHDDTAMDPLVRMAAAHYQFEAIHPFGDGNGRTGRILNVLMLMHAGLLPQPVLYLSSYILQHKPDYYRLLREVTERDAWEPWTLFMLEAVEQTAHRTLKLIQDILALKELLTAGMRGISQKMPVTDLAELLFSFPYVKIATLMEHGLGSRPTATGYLRALTERKVLHEVRIGRENYFINHRLTDLLAKAGAG
jgi:Fic family protein